MTIARPRHYFRAIAAVLAAAALFVGCSDDASNTPESLCGNGAIEFFEECDDGNSDPLDGCHQCRLWTPPSGETLALERDGTWQWFPIEGAKCRDGSQAGFSVNAVEGAKDLMVYFEGGGACFEVLNCTQNPASIPEGSRWPGPVGMFNRGQETNPFKDWNIVYLPYCTGDVFSGSTTNVVVDKVPGVQQFVGDTNMRLFVDRLVPTFSDTERLAITGISAGGMSAVANTQRLSRAFGEAEVTLIDDGGPPLSQTYLPACLQSWWNELWALDQSVLADCGAGCSTSENFLMDVTTQLVRSDPSRVHGLFSYKGDSVVRLLYSFGANNCRMLPVPYMKEEALAAGLDEFRQIVRDQSDRFGTYYAPGTAHTCIQSDCLYGMEVDGVKLTTWMQDLIDRRVSHVGQ